MNIRDRIGLKTAAARRLSQAAFEPRKLVLLHTGVSLAASFLLTLINVIVSEFMQDNVGLSGLQTRAMLESVRSFLESALSIAMPFWQAGMVFAALQLARGESARPGSLFAGFRRLGPVLRLLLLRVLLISLLIFGGIYITFRIYGATPFAQGLNDALLPYADAMAQGQTPVLDEATAQLVLHHTMPVMIFALVVTVAVLIPVLLRLRFAEQLVMDGENRAWGALKASWQLSKGNTLAMLGVDLHFWWFYLLLGLSSLVCYGDLLLPMVGMELPLSPAVASMVFYVLYLLIQLALYGLAGARYYTTYALAYDSLVQSPVELAVMDE